mgnify:FL=1
MKLYAIIPPLCMLFSQSIIGADVQRLAGGKILIDSVMTQKMGDSLSVRFRLNLDSLSLKSEQQLVYTPMLVGEDSLALSPIIINGRNQDIRYKRLAQSKKQGDALVIRRRNDTSQQAYYEQSVPYKKWMRQFQLSVKEDLCGCGNLQDQDTTLLANFRENATELGKITKTIDLVKNDKDVEITNIDIHGYASPDGPYANNQRLANARAAALRNYVSGLYELDDKLFTFHATPEDWEGFKKKVSESSLADKEAILKIANSSLAPDAKDQKIRKLYPASYRHIMSDIYPRLRHSDYTVTYTVRPFDVEEAKEILKTKPQQLSLQEMYLVAQTYEPGSPEFNEVFDIAVRLFPDDPTANLNAACTELQKGNLQAAEKYLAKAGHSKAADRIRKIYEEMKAEQ